jgi:hypothetical protein
MIAYTNEHVSNIEYPLYLSEMGHHRSGGYLHEDKVPGCSIASQDDLLG